MKRVGFEKARGRLKHAYEAAEQLKAAANWEQIDDAWTRFLTALSAVYEILEASCRGDPKSEGWFSQVKGRRKSDDLLGYLMHARNANDHGIEKVLQFSKGSIAVGVGAHEVYIEELVLGPNGIETLRGSQDGGPIQVLVTPAQIHLLPVVDRSIQYSPPKSFMGKDLSDDSLLGVATVALEFMTRLFGEAEEFVSQGAR